MKLIKNTPALQDTFILLMNYLAVVYAIFLPISSHSRATIFSLIIILFLFRRNYLFYIKKSISNPIVQALLLYILMHFIWLLGSDNPKHADKMIRLTEYAIIPFIFLTFLTKEFAQKVITAFIGTVLFSELLSYLIRFELLPVKMQFMKATLYQAVDRLDPSPFLLHMHYTVTLSIVIAFLFFRILSTTTPLNLRLIYSFFMLSATLNLSLIGGRSGYLSFIVLLFSIVILKYRKRALYPLLAITIFLSTVAFTAYSLSPMFQERIDYSKKSIATIYNNPKDLNTSMGQRLGLWRYSIDIINDNLLFGVGTGDQMDELHNRLRGNDTRLTYFHHLHNAYIEVFTQFGIIGLLIFLNIFYQIFRYKDISSKNKNILYITTIAIMIALLTETFSTRYYLPLLAIIISATLSKNTFLRKKKELSKRNELFIYTSIFLVIILTSVF